MQGGVGVIEDPIFGDRALGPGPVGPVVAVELRQRPIRDVVDPLLADKPVARHLLVGVHRSPKVQARQARYGKNTEVGS